MKKYALIFLGLLPLLSACGLATTTALFKPNTPPAVKQADLDQCKIASFRAIPQAYTTDYVGGYYNPGYTDCSRSRHGNYYCSQYGGYYAPPVAFTEDMNASLRWRFVESCLRKKGYYILYNKPPCGNGADRARALRAKTPADLVCNPDINLDY